MPHVAVQAAYVAFRKTGLNAICALWYARNVASPQVTLNGGPVAQAVAEYAEITRGWFAPERPAARTLWRDAYRHARSM